MNHPARTLAALLGLATLLLALAASTAPGRNFVDVLDQPALRSPLAAKRVLQATAVAGQRLVAAGARGHVVYSDDLGASWQQAKVPVSADLTALHFVDARQGWAVGHEGVVLHTGDGGKTWEPWVDRTQNERFYHLYGIRGSSDGLYMVGELGLALRFDPATGRFNALQTPYEGSYFGLLTKPGLVLAYGLRGTAYRSRDGGQNWEAVDTGITASITASHVLPDGRLLLCSMAGDVLQSDDDGAHFRRVTLKTPMPCTGLAVSGDALVLSGLRGVRVEHPQL